MARCNGSGAGERGPGGEAVRVLAIAPDDVLGDVGAGAGDRHPGLIVDEDLDLGDAPVGAPQEASQEDQENTPASSDIPDEDAAQAPTQAPVDAPTPVYVEEPGDPTQDVESPAPDPDARELEP